MNIILYTTHCPKCQILKTKLEQKKLQYIEVSDISVLEAKGIEEVPVLEVNGIMMKFATANEWVNNYNN